MNTKDQIIAIAEAVGWVKQKFSGAYWSEMYVKEWTGLGTIEPVEVLSEDKLPVYPECLNAIREAVVSVLTTESQKYKFFSILYDLVQGVEPDDDVTYQSIIEVSNMYMFSLLTAKPELWAEAFLRTINKWNEH
jgi:hypothetical protein